METCFVDLHVHLGRSASNKPVKITAAKDMTLERVLEQSSAYKGLAMVGVIDCGSMAVQEDLRTLIATGKLKELPEGGLAYQATTLILGAEIETSEVIGAQRKRGSAHFLCYFPQLHQITAFSRTMSRYITNMNLSSQKASLSAEQLAELVFEHEGIMLPAHAFTPHKGVYGNVTDRLDKLFSPAVLERINVIELGLSSDTQMADQLSELQRFTFLTNSDAHSLPNIAREYNQVLLKDKNFEELRAALRREEGRAVVTNFGLQPALGKYHRSYCELCGANIEGEAPQTKCPQHGERPVTLGVLDRLVQIADQVSASPGHRPPYIYQVPLHMLPKVGPKLISKLLAAFGTEMNVLHRVAKEDLAKVAGEQVANTIEAMRQGRLLVAHGGGGTYGKIQGLE